MKKTLVLMIFAPILMNVVFAQDGAKADYDWYRPGTINPLDPAIGDFLDIDLNDLLAQADEHYAAADYLNAARLYLVYLRFNIDDPVATYNLACCYGLMEKPILAAGYLHRAVRDGFRDLGQIENDPDFDAVRGYPQFRKVYDSLTALIERQHSEEGTIRQVDLGIPTECHISMPKYFNPGKKYPLVIGLHGAGGNPAEFMRTFSDSEQKDYIYVTIPGPYAVGGAYQEGYVWYRRNPLDSIAERNSHDAAVEYIARAVKYFRTEYNINRAVLVGFSMGSRIGFSAVVRHYDLIDAFVSFGGGMRERFVSDEELPRGQRVEIYLVNGINDLAVSPDEAIETKQLLEKAGYQVVTYSFDGGHYIPKNLLEETLRFAAHKN